MADLSRKETFAAAHVCAPPKAIKADEKWACLCGRSWTARTIWLADRTYDMPKEPNPVRWNPR